MKIFWIFFINILISYNYCEKPDNQLLVKKTIPWSNERLSVLINKLGDESCYHEEKCAQNWLQKLNFLTEKIFERGSFLQVNFLKTLDKIRLKPIILSLLLKQILLIIIKSNWKNFLQYQTDLVKLLCELPRNISSMFSLRIES